MKHFYLSLLFLVVFSGSSFSQKKIDALFIGNSYIYTNNLPQLIADIATSFGDTLVKDENDPGGYTFENHSTDPTTLAKIAQQSWDYVILQEQSQKPAFPPLQVAQDVYPFADSLNRKIKENDSCTTTLFYMTWGRKNGDAANCPFYSWLCTYDSMQYRLRTSYLQMGQMFDAEVCPAGSAWWRTRIDYPSIELYNVDESHPSPEGSYLVACNFYSVMFRKSCVGAYIPAGMDSATAMILQQVAYATVFDSLSTWNIDTTALSASFSHSDLGNGNISFTDQSSGAHQWTWNFGDGNSSSTQNPSHVYDSSGVYTITLIISKGCESDTITDTVHVQLLSLSDVNGIPGLKIYPNPVTENMFYFSGLTNEKELTWILTDVCGKIISSGKTKGSNRIETGNVNDGIYFLKVADESRSSVFRIVFSGDK